jgi:hypothetical protein
MSKRARVERLEKAAGGGGGWAGPVIQRRDGLLRLPDGTVLTHAAFERLYPDKPYILLPAVEGEEDVETVKG